MSGNLYGVSVGPGDPELLTFKAVRFIRQCPVIAVPQSGAQEEPMALSIARQVVPEILEKELLELPLPMTRDSDELERAHKAAVDAICFYLRKGMDVAFLTLGDVSIYSTYGHLCERVRACGFEAEMISGVPSFCAAAARIGETLAIAGKPLQILPASYHGLEEGLRRAGTKVLMKTGHSLRAVKEKLRELGLYEKAKLVENCGLPDEHIYHSLDQVGEEAGYFSLIVVQE